MSPETGGDCGGLDIVLIKNENHFKIYSEKGYHSTHPKIGESRVQ